MADTRHAVATPDDAQNHWQFDVTKCLHDDALVTRSPVCTKYKTLAILKGMLASHSSSRFLASQGFLRRSYHFKVIRQKLASLAIPMHPTQRVPKALRVSIDVQIPEP